MDWIALVAFLLKAWQDCQAKGNFSGDQAGIEFVRSHPILARLAIRRGLKEQGLHGIALHTAMEDAIEELDVMSDEQLMGYVKQTS